MSKTKTSVTTCIYDDDPFAQGYRHGTLRTDSFGGISICFMEDDPIPQLAQLRDECQRQITAIEESRKPSIESVPFISTTPTPEYAEAPPEELARLLEVPQRSVTLTSAEEEIDVPF